MKSWMDRVSDFARDKLGQPEGFGLFHFEKIHCDLLVEGGISRPITRGPRKGEPTWRECKDTVQCIITADELAQIDREIKAEKAALAP